MQNNMDKNIKTNKNLISKQNIEYQSESNIIKQNIDKQNKLNSNIEDNGTIVFKDKTPEDLCAKI